MIDISHSSWLYYVLVGAYCMNLSIMIVISIGWLTCSSYYYRVCEVIDSVGVGIFSVFMCIISLMLLLSHFSPDDSMSIGMLSVNLLVVAAVILMAICGYTYDGIMAVRSYYANKRGRT